MKISGYFGVRGQRLSEQGFGATRAANANKNSFATIFSNISTKSKQPLESHPVLTNNDLLFHFNFYNFAYGTHGAE